MTDDLTNLTLASSDEPHRISPDEPAINLLATLCTLLKSLAPTARPTASRALLKTHFL